MRTTMNRDRRFLSSNKILVLLYVLCGSSLLSALIIVPNYMILRERSHGRWPTEKYCKLTCRLSPVVPESSAGGDLAVVFELRNVASAAADIGYEYWPHEHLTLRIVNKEGAIVLELPYAALKSIATQPEFLRLNPGEKYSTKLYLGLFLGNYRKKLVEAEVCSLSGVYQDGDETSHCPTVEFIITPER